MSRLRILWWKILPGLCGLCFCLTLNPFPAGADLAASRERLEQVQQQIRRTLKDLRSKQATSGALTEDLERLASEVRQIEDLVAESDRQLSRLTTQIRTTRQDLETIDKQKQTTEQQIRQRLVVLYKTGEVGLIRALFSAAETPRDIAEKYVFFSRMVRHDRTMLATYRQQIADRQAALAKLENLQEEQVRLTDQRRREQESLQKARNSKQVLLAEVRKDTEILDRLLADLRARAARLNDLVKKLETEQTQPYTENLQGILAQKGRLPWPVPGRLRTGFGTSRHGALGTLIESHGFDIAADVGTPVHAVAKGQVIYANALRGYGKLIILDHGNKYYTLYAHMARFTKQVGNTVAAAEVIAYSGHEGRDAIYFEIRQGGKPLDPADWLKPR
ncbi:MAG: peptidoglycan DD-metalloendopeptidase family protein [Desulfuromonadales bacterium]